MMIAEHKHVIINFAAHILTSFTYTDCHSIGEAPGKMIHRLGGSGNGAAATSGGKSGGGGVEKSKTENVPTQPSGKQHTGVKKDVVVDTETIEKSLDSIAEQTERLVQFGSSAPGACSSKGDSTAPTRESKKRARMEEKVEVCCTCMRTHTQKMCLMTSENMHVRAYVQPCYTFTICPLNPHHT